jgi:two-component system cell cycle sensor histidine kinase/response regulator CckA
VEPQEKAGPALPSIVPRVALRLGLVIAIQVVVVVLLALAAPRTLSSLGNYLVGTPSRALAVVIEQAGQDLAEQAQVVARLADPEAVPPPAGAEIIAFTGTDTVAAAEWPDDWPVALAPTLTEWLAQRSPTAGPAWCTAYDAGRLYVAGAAPRPNDEGWVVVLADYTEPIGAAASRVAGARDLSIVPADEAAPVGTTVSLGQITSGRAPASVSVPGMVGPAGRLDFTVPTRGIGTPLRAGALILLSSVLLLAGAQTLAFVSTYAQLMQPYRDLLRALDAYATSGRWHSPSGRFREQLMAVTAISRAVEAREQAEEQARRRLDELRAFVDALPAPAAVKDADMRYRLVNSALARLVGRAPEELIGKTNLDLLDPAFARVCAGHDCQVLQSGQTLQFEEVMEVEGKRRTFRTVKAPLTDPEGRVTGLVSVALDITGEREMQARLVEAQKASMVARLAGGVAHIFNNVLTAIIGSSELALMDLPDDHPARQDIMEIKAAANRGARVSRQLLVLGRGQRGQESSALVHEVIEDLLPMLREMAGTQIELVTAVSPELPPVMVDPGELKQVVLNLVLNATEAMPDGGRVRVESQVVEPPAEVVRMEPALAERPTVRLRVSDTGVGVSPEAREHLFEPFFTTKGASAGRGLGLAVVQSIVRSHQGVVLFQPQEGGGTSFDVYLPGKLQPERAEGPGAKANGGDGKGQGVILLAEDEPSVRQLTERMLSSQGYTLWTAARGDEALEIVEAKGQPPDLLLTDVVMPGMTGVELALALKDRYPSVRVLLMSGYMGGSDDDLQGFPLLWKPFTLDGLTQTVRQVLDEQS